MDVSEALAALEALSSSPSTSASGPLTTLLDRHLAVAKERLQAGSDPKRVIEELQVSVARSKKEVEKGLKGWYGALGNLGKAVDKAFPPNLAAVSAAYNDPPLFSTPEAHEALDKVVMESLGRRGLWDAVAAMEEESGMRYDASKRELSQELHRIVEDLQSGDVTSALAWCDANAPLLAEPPHASSLPYQLHRSVFLRLGSPAEALAYARKHLMPFLSTQPVTQLITSCLYSTSSTSSTSATKTPGGGASAVEDGSPYVQDIADKYDFRPLVVLFRTEFCRRHALPKEEPLEVVVDLGSRGGALNVIEKARRVMGDRLGNIRTWDELPMEVPLPPSRRYHSVFVCPVSKEQATEANPPTMLSCGHTIAKESFNRMMKGGRRSAKCPYCPIETSSHALQRLYL